MKEYLVDLGRRWGWPCFGAVMWGIGWAAVHDKNWPIVAAAFIAFLAALCHALMVTRECRAQKD